MQPLALSCQSAPHAKGVSGLTRINVRMQAAGNGDAHGLGISKFCFKNVPIYETPCDQNASVEFGVVSDLLQNECVCRILINPTKSIRPSSGNTKEEASAIIEIHHKNLTATG